MSNEKDSATAGATVPSARPVTPKKGEPIILKHLCGRYPRATHRAIRRGSWHVYCQHLRCLTDTTFSVATDPDRLNEDGSVTVAPRVDVDILAGTCTCEAGAPCEHYFAAVVWTQMDALDRAYRAAHPNTCRKRWCAGRRNPWRLLCETHSRERHRELERQELQELRACRLIVELRGRLHDGGGDAMSAAS